MYIILGDKLTWKEHLDHVNTKLCKSVGILNKLKHILSIDCLVKLYNSFVLPHLNYCNLIWGAASQSALSKVVITQKRAIKMVLKVPRNTPTDTIFTKSKLRTVGGINRVQTSVFMYKYEYGLLPSGFHAKYTKNEVIHGHNTRQAILYHLPQIGTNRFKTSLYYRGPKIWNCLPNYLREIQTLPAFKSQIKQFFI